MKIQDLLEAKKTPDEMKTLARQLQGELKRMPEGRWCEIQDPELYGGKLMADIRHWGQWNVPDDEEDDGDYDWKELDKKSSTSLDKKVKEFAKLNKVKIEWKTGEKEYISLHFS